MISQGVLGYLTIIARNSLLIPGSSETEEPINTSGDMGRYEKTVDLVAGINDITTELLEKPFSLLIYDSSGKIINSELGNPKFTLNEDGFYHISIYTSDPMTIEIKASY
jgi:hypothetical protein